MVRIAKNTAAACLLAGIVMASPLLHAKTGPDTVCADDACTVTYDPGFFALYAPVTALDMIRNLPGFVLDNGGGSRGFGGAAGNVLIDGKRVSTKSESSSDLLSRIPAAEVERVLLIRGRAGGLDLPGQSVVVNVVRRAHSSSGAWRLGVSNYQPQSGLFPSAELAYSHAQGPSKLTLSVEAAEYRSLRHSNERLFAPNGDLLERRDEVSDEDGEEYRLTVNASFSGNAARYGLNVDLEHADERGGEVSVRSPSTAAPFRVFQGDTHTQDSFELGADVERDLGRDWSAKAIGLYRYADRMQTGSLERGAEAASVEALTASDSRDTEAILRIELDYRGFDGHLLEASIEGARNRADSDFELRQRVDGQLVVVDVPGAASTIEETRVDFTISDSFRLGAVLVDATLGGEVSDISQTGDFSEERSFFFWKPSLTLSYAFDAASQLRMRLLRQVAQLDFSDFTSAADLGDVELSLGNPELSPERSFTIDLTVERRFGPVGTVSMTLFHDRIADVQDVLPFEGILEVPGNIGSGRRAGLRGELTVPLDSLGLLNARLDASGEWQSSRVTDPLTGARRELSDERGWELEATVRQDLQRRKLAWGLTASADDGFSEFGLDELDDRGGRFDIDAFIETRVVDGMRIRLGSENLLRDGASRDRRVFEGQRDTTPLAFREVRDRRSARELFVEVEGVF